MKFSINDFFSKGHQTRSVHLFFWRTFFHPVSFEGHVTNAKLYRSSCPDVFREKGILRNFTKFTGKHLCQSLYFNKVTGLRT